MQQRRDHRRPNSSSPFCPAIIRKEPLSFHLSKHILANRSKDKLQRVALIQHGPSVPLHKHIVCAMQQRTTRQAAPKLRAASKDLTDRYFPVGIATCSKTIATVVSIRSGATTIPIPITILMTLAIVADIRQQQNTKWDERSRVP